MNMRNDNASNSILSKIEELVKPLGKLPKTWHHHLSKNLDKYMECIEELTRDDALGLTAINFIQAGIMIENTTKVYAANVDCLWQFMTEVLEVLRMNKRSENRRSEVAESSSHHEEGCKRSRKRAVFEDFEEIVPRVIDPDMKAEERSEPIKTLPLQRHIMAKTDWKRRKRSYQIFDVDGDSLVPTDYSVMLQTSMQGKLQLNMLKEMVSEFNEAEQQSLCELIHVLEILVKELSQSDADEDGTEDSGDRIDEILNLPSVGAPSENTSEDVPLPVTPPPSPELIKRSASDVESPLPIKRSMSDAESEREVCVAGLSARRPKEKEHLVTVPPDPWETVPFEKGMEERPLRRKETYKLPCDIKLLKPDEKKRKSGHEEKVKLMVEYHGTKMLSTYVKQSCFPFYPDFKKFYLRDAKQKKLMLRNQPDLYSFYSDLEELHRRLSKECDEDFFGFEDYEPELGEEEGGFRGFPDEEEADDDVDGENGNADSDDIDVPLVGDEAQGIESRPESSKDMPFENHLFAQSDIAPDTNHEHEEIDITRRVAEWERFIRPKLKVAHDRGHFDIHGVGTEILKSFPRSPAKVTLQFDQFVADKPTEDIPRYFLAALQLANTCNIELSKSIPGDLSMDCMEMTLLSPVRHHEVLEDYEATSQGSKRKHRANRGEAYNRDSESDGECIPSTSTCKRERKRNKR